MEADHPRQRLNSLGAYALTDKDLVALLLEDDAGGLLTERLAQEIPLPAHAGALHPAPNSAGVEGRVGGAGKSG